MKEKKSKAKKTVRKKKIINNELTKENYLLLLIRVGKAESEIRKLKDDISEIREEARGNYHQHVPGGGFAEE